MKILTLVRKIPVFGNIFWIANAYAFGADSRSSSSFAPLRLWFKAFFWNLLVAAIATGMISFEFSESVFRHIICGAELVHKIDTGSLTAGSVIFSIYPNLLGLGIGIYALLYALDSSIVVGMHKRLEAARLAGQRNHGSVLMINSDMAFPLCIFLLITIMGLIAQLFPLNFWIQLISWYAFWYGMVLILELIALLFVLIDNSLLAKLEEDAQRQSGGTAGGSGTGGGGTTGGSGPTGAPTP